MDQKVGSAYIEILAKMDKLEASITSEIQTLGEKAGKEFTDGFKDSIQGLTSAITSVVSMGAIKQLGGEILGLANNLQQSHIAFTTMLGSAEASEKLLTELSDFAAKTPFEIQGIRENAKQLLAMGVSVDQLKPTLKALGDVASGTGADFTRLALNYGQVVTQGYLTGRELKDFAVNGIPLLAELSAMLGKTEVEVQKMISNGEISSEIVAKVFEKMTSEGGKFANMMDAQSKSLGGLMSSLEDEIALTGETIGNQFLPMASEIVSAISGVVEKIREWVQEHPTATKAIVSFVAVGGSLLAFLGMAGPAIVALKVALAALTGPVGWAVLAIAALTAGGFALAVALEETSFKAKYAEETFASLKEKMEENQKAQEELTQAYKDGAIELTEYEEAMKKLKEENEELRKAQDRTQMSLDDVRNAIDEVNNTKLKNEEKLQRLKEVEDRAFGARSEIGLLKAELASLDKTAALVEKSKEKSVAGFAAHLRLNLRDHFSFLPGVDSVKTRLEKRAKLQEEINKKETESLGIRTELTNNILQIEEKINKAKSGGGGGGGGSGSKSKRSEELKAQEQAYKDLGKEIDNHNKNIEKAQEAIEKLNERYEQLQNNARKALTEAKHHTAELLQQQTAMNQSIDEKLIDRHLKVQEELKKMEEKSRHIKRLAEEMSDKDLQRYLDNGGERMGMRDTTIGQIKEYKKLLAELDFIRDNMQSLDLQDAKRFEEEVQATKDMFEAEKILIKELEKRSELQAKINASQEQEAINRAFLLKSAKAFEFAYHEETGELTNARYKNEEGKLVEIQNLKNMQYAQDLDAKRSVIDQERQLKEEQIRYEQEMITQYNKMRTQMEQNFTKTLKAEVQKQKSEIDGLIAKYRELAAAKAKAGYSGGRAFGGEVKAGTPYLIGENFKPELFVPSVSGSVVPVNNYNQSKSYSFSGVTINSNNAQDFWSQIQHQIGDYT